MSLFRHSLPFKYSIQFLHFVSPFLKKRKLTTKPQANENCSATHVRVTTHQLRNIGLDKATMHRHVPKTHDALILLDSKGVKRRETDGERDRERGREWE